MTTTSVVDRLVRLLVERHDITATSATDIVARAAGRKGITMDDIAAFVMDRVPLPARAIAS